MVVRRRHPKAHGSGSAVHGSARANGLFASAALWLTALMAASVVASGFGAAGASASGAPRVTPRAAASNLAYTPLTPQRIADTRCGASPAPSFCASEGLPAANSALATVSAGGNINVAMPSTVPAAASAAVFSLTAVDQTGPGFLTAYPTGGTLPVVSSLNYATSQATFGVSNLVTVQLGSSSVTIFNGPAVGGGKLDVVVDLEGYYAPPGSNPAGQFFPLAPSRILDTRSIGSPVGPGSTDNLTVTGAGGVPTTGVQAVLANFTVTNTTAPSFLTIFPVGGSQPVVSNLNWTTGETLSNKVLVPLGTGGALSIFNLSGNADIIVDVEGWISSSSSSASGNLFTPLTPARMADTRCGVSPAPSFCSSESLPAANAALKSPSGGQAVTLGITGNGSVPATATAGVLNVVDVSPAGGNFLTVHATGTAVPLASDVNWVPGDVSGIVSNGSYAPLGTGGATDIYQGPATASLTDVVADLFGYFAPASGVTVSESPATLQADGVSTSVITVNVTNSGAAVASDPVLITTSATPAGSCGTITTANPANTNASGVATFTYRASTTGGTCAITATEANNGHTGSGTILQTANNAVAVVLSPTSVPADGHSASTVTVTVTSPTSTPVPSDTITFTTSSAPSGACGGVLPASAATNASGVVTATYVAGTVAGFCTLTATEQAAAPGTSQKGSAAVDQTTTPAPANSPYVVTASAAPASIQANGTSTSTITVTVKDSTTAAVAGDEVILSTSPAPAGSCGTLASTTGTTSAGGTLSDVYTSSTTAGTCTITAQEAATAQSGATAVTQTATNTVAVSASPNTFPANGAATSTVTVTVTGPTNAPVSGDTVTFVFTPTPAGACGTATPAGPYTTNASGQVVLTYTASATSGFCAIAATESATSQSGSVTIDQTSLVTPTTILVSASPSTLPASGASTSTVTVTVLRSSTPVAGDPVTFSSSGAPAASCGILSASSSPSNGAGQVTVTYTSSTTGGTCTITAKEADAGLTGSTGITQSSNNTVAVSASPAAVVANGTSTTTVTVTVTNPAAVPVSGDAITLTTSASPAGACGTLGSLTGTTNGSGQLVETYIATSTVGFCTITATEQATAPGTGQNGSGMVTQSSAAPAGAPYSVAVVPTPATLQANGTSTSTVVVTVTNTGSTAVSSDPVMITMSPSVAGACGHLSASTGTTNGAGQVSVTYTSNTGTAGTCTLTATEAIDAVNHTAVITQTANNSVTAAANPASIQANGTSTSTVTVTVTSVTGTVVSGDTVTFVTTPSPAGACGTLTPAGPYTTNASGQVVLTYTASNTVGFCGIVATESATAQSSTSVSINQHA